MAKRPVAKFAGRELRATIRGELVVVKLDPSNLTYYANPPAEKGRGRERKWLSRDLGKSAQEFWAMVEASQRGNLVQVPEVERRVIPSIEITTPREQFRTDEEYEEAVKQLGRVVEYVGIPHDVENSIPESTLAQIFRQWLQDPYQAAIKVGDERLAHLDQLTVREAVKLSDMGQYYHSFVPTDREQASSRERDKVRGWWGDFCRIIGRATLDELRKEDVGHYATTIVGQAKKGGYSRTWVSHRFGAIRTVLNTYKTRMDDKTLVEKVLGWMKDYPCPQKINGNGDTYDPQRLSREQWQELLDMVSQGKSRTQVEWKAIILFALNTCSYGIDCRQVQMSHIKGHELRLRRSKTGVAKIGWLWPETLEAIKEFRGMGKISGSPYVFPSRAGGEYSEGGWYDYWSRHIRPKLSFKWDFEQLRDSGRYGAETGEASSNSILMAMGHRLPGVSDNYLFRHPELVEPVSQAIHKYYME